VLLANLLAAVNLSTFFNSKKSLQDKKMLKTKKRDQNKNVKNVVYIHAKITIADICRVSVGGSSAD